MMVFGLLGKFGTLFITIPEPIIGGVFCIMFSMITAVGLSTLHFVDLNSSRNLFVLGFSIFMGLCIPKWLQAHPGVINTGSSIFDQIATVLMSTNMLVGGFIGFVLDNTIPGTDEERGVLKWKKHEHGNAELTASKISTSYDIPFITPMLRKVPLFSYLPISPTYDEENVQSRISYLGKCMKS
ncbi:Solute carrier family 23 member 1, partial [Stegodyphus mimosarum]